MFESNEAERDDLADRCSQSEKKIIDVRDQIRSELEEKQLKMHDKVDIIERNISMAVDKTIRTVDTLKVELMDTLEQKFDQIQQMFDSELSKVRTRYEEIIGKVGEAGHLLNISFKKKVGKLKEKSAVFFAKLEMKMSDNNNEVIAISQMFRAQQEKIGGPSQKYGA